MTEGDHRRYSPGYYDDTDRWMQASRRPNQGPEGSPGYGPSERRTYDYGDEGYDRGMNRQGGYGRGETGDEYDAYGSMGGYGRANQAGGGPHAGRGPKNYQRSDDRICEDVCEALTHHGQVDASEIEVSVEGGEVTLRGTVDNRRTKRMAVNAIEHISGIRDIHNQLRIHPDHLGQQSSQQGGQQSSQQGGRQSGGGMEGHEG